MNSRNARCAETWPLRLGQGLAVAAWLLLCVAPIGWLLARLVVFAATDLDTFLSLAIGSSRRWILIARSLALAVAVAAVCTGLALHAAWSWRHGSRRTRGMLIACTVLVVVPPYIHSAVWLASPGSAAAAWAGTLLCQVLSFAPLSVALVLLGSASLNHEALEAGRLAAPPGRCFRKVTLPMLRGVLLSGAALVFVLSLSDTATPLRAALPLAQHDVHIVFARTGRADRAAAVALVPALLGAGVLWMVRRRPVELLSAMASTEVHPPDEQTRGAAPWVPLLLFAGPAALAVHYGMEIGGPGPLREGLVASGPALVNTLLGSAVAAVACALVAVGLSRWLVQRGGLAWFVLLLPLVLLPALTGPALKGLWNRRWLSGLNDSVLMLSIGQAARFLPVAALVFATMWVGRSARAIEAVSLSPVRLHRRLVEGYLPMLAPGVVVAGLAVFALSVRELEVSMMMHPPGHQPLSVRLFSYLHYGASTDVAADVLLMLALVASAAALPVVLLWRRRRAGEVR